MNNRVCFSMVLADNGEAPRWLDMVKAAMLEAICRSARAILKSTGVNEVEDL